VTALQLCRPSQWTVPWSSHSIL